MMALNLVFLQIQILSLLTHQNLMKEKNETDQEVLNHLAFIDMSSI